MTADDLIGRYDYTQKSADWWRYVQDVLDNGSQRDCSRLLMELSSRKAGLTGSINRYKRIVSGESQPGNTTLALCLMLGVDYVQMMKTRLEGCAALLEETNDQLALVRGWNVS